VGSPLEITVKSDLNSVKTSATGPGLENPTEGEPTHFTVTVKDPRGNSITGVSASVTAHISGVAASAKEE
jgi:C4-type Zn-finger protein